jgi:hypothetical protein
VSETYVVVAATIIGTPEKYEHIYDSDGRTYDDRSEAISAGFNLRGSDDFNIGVLHAGRLVELAWMDERIDEEPSVLAEIARQLGIRP